MKKILMGILLVLIVGACSNTEKTNSESYGNLEEMQVSDVKTEPTPESKYNKGMEMWLNGETDEEMEKGLNLIMESAQQGNADAQYNLGVLYANGRGVLQDYKEAAYWYEKSAEQGDAAAQYNLGLLYYNGQGVLQDYKEAAYWWEKSAQQGDAAAQYNLGMLYEKRDKKQAYIWYSVAYKFGTQDAKSKISKLKFNMDFSELKDADQQVEKLCNEIMKL